MSCAFFLVWPFSQPDAELQNCDSNMKWLTIAEKRTLTSRYAPVDLVDPPAHVIKITALGDAAEDAEGVVVRIK
jgi:hypothetical protein